jgi:hypothetical protein
MTNNFFWLKKKINNKEHALEKSVFFIIAYATLSFERGPPAQDDKRERVSLYLHRW